LLILVNHGLGKFTNLQFVEIWDKVLVKLVNGNKRTTLTTHDTRAELAVLVVTVLVYGFSEGDGTCDQLGPDGIKPQLGGLNIFFLKGRYAKNVADDCIISIPADHLYDVITKFGFDDGRNLPLFQPESGILEIWIPVLLCFVDFVATPSLLAAWILRIKPGKGFKIFLHTI
jgi:hypothetical protein